MNFVAQILHLEVFIAKLQVRYALGLKPVRRTQNPNQGAKEPMERSGGARRVLFRIKSTVNSISIEAKPAQESRLIWVHQHPENLDVLLMVQLPLPNPLRQK